MLKSLLDFINNIEHNAYIIEVGCGEGKNLLKLKEFGFNFIEACDNSLKCVEECKNKNLNVIEANILSLPYCNNSFDITLCIFVINYLESEKLRLHAITELIRITKNNGLIFLAVNFTEMCNINFQNYHLFEEHELLNLCNNLNQYDINIIKENYCSIAIVHVTK